MICRLWSFLEDFKVVSLHLNKEPPDKADAHEKWGKPSLETYTVQGKKAFVETVLPMKQMKKTDIPGTCDHVLQDLLFD